VSRTGTALRSSACGLARRVVLPWWRTGDQLEAHGQRAGWHGRGLGAGEHEGGSLADSCGGEHMFTGLFGLSPQFATP
jgi:hypothetical protein